MSHCVKQIWAVILSLALIVSCSNTAGAITILEEKKLADKFIKMIRQQDAVMTDPIANHLVRSIGNHLVSKLDNQPFDYTFYVIDEDVFNAFASPGANIFFYRGLITALETVDELAGIVGHEIAHAASRHVSEAIDRSKWVSMGTMAGVLAGVLIGATSDGDAGASVATGAAALGQSTMLAYTRENETEADEKGVMFLKQSCFNPKGLLSGLMKIRQSDFFGVEQIPEYFKTHPGTGNRIAHLENLLEGYVPAPQKPGCPEDFRFDMVKYRLLGLYADTASAFDIVQKKLAQDPSNAALHYGIGLLYERKFMPDKAVEHMQKALSINVFDPLILLELGRLRLAHGSPEKALNTLGGLESDPVIGVMARFHQSCARLETGALSRAKSGLDFVINKLPTHYPEAYLKLANIYSLEKNQGMSAYNLGLYYIRLKKEKTAILHLERALDALADGKEKKRAEKLLAELKKKKRTQPARSGRRQ